MTPLPEQPFFTDDFSPGGGGIDFLGLRYVNLNIVGNYLIPELNNVTQDMGTFFLGAWIPWKFADICEKRDFTEKNYRQFREKVEVAISLNMRDDSSASKLHGNVRTRVGVTQNCKLPNELTFKNAKRSKENSIYAAALYGPAIRYLGLINSYRSQAQDGYSINIPVSADNSDSISIVESIDKSLASVPAYKALISLSSDQFSPEDVDELGKAGLCPSVYRSSEFDALKPCFQRKLLPDDPENPGFARTRTARLLLETLQQRAPLHVDNIRNAWYTGAFDDGSRLVFADQGNLEHSKIWSYFMARQYQRYAIELFLWCFETALLQGARSIDDVVDYWDTRTKGAEESLDSTFRDILTGVAGDLCRSDDMTTSEKWNFSVHAKHEHFEFIKDPQGDLACLSGLRMFAGWYWRMLYRVNDTEHKNLMDLGHSDRMGMAWFLEWLEKRQELPLRSMLKDIFSNLVFSQHMRVALSRFDGHSQRLRFVLGDSGIEPTVSAGNDLGKRGLPWMPDRLDTLADLLCDLSILQRGEDGTLSLGRRADSVAAPTK